MNPIDVSDFSRHYRLPDYQIECFIFLGILCFEFGVFHAARQFLIKNDMREASEISPYTGPTSMQLSSILELLCAVVLTFSGFMYAFNFFIVQGSEINFLLRQEALHRAPVLYLLGHILMDSVLGFFYYQDQMTWASHYFHHLLHVCTCSFAIFVSPFGAAFVLWFPMELSTIFYDLRRVIPRIKTSYLTYSVIFVSLRIIYQFWLNSFFLEKIQHLPDTNWMVIAVFCWSGLLYHCFLYAKKMAKQAKKFRSL